MPSSSCRSHGSKLTRESDQGKSYAQDSKLTMSKIPKVQQVATTAKQIKTKTSDSANPNQVQTQDNAQQGQQDRWQLKQWHKLMDDYERLQFVASSRAHNKLVESTSESSINSSISRASTVFEASDRVPSRVAREPSELSSSVGQCLNELVDSVASSSSGPQQVTIPERVFSLHEAVLAKTNSGSSAANTSEEEENFSGCDETKPDLSLDGIRIESLNCIELDPSDTHQKILIKAREISRSLITTGTKLSLAFSHHSGISIECFDENNNKCETLSFDLVAECLQYDQLVVWLLRSGSGDQQESDSNEMNCASLDLDDIALALNEPVPSKRSTGSIESKINRALIWRCSRGSRDARRLQDVWSRRRMEMKMNLLEQDPKGAIELSNSIEVKTDEAAISSAIAAQLKSSGLFVRGTEAVGVHQKSLPKSDNVDQSGGSPGESSRKEFTSSGSIRESRLDHRSILKGSKLERISVQRDEVSINQQNQQNLANYYRSVASRVFSNGSSKLKSLTLESGQTLARGARRLSMALNQQQAVSANQATGSTGSKLESGGTKVCPKPPKAKPRTSILRGNSSSKPEEILEDCPGESCGSKQPAGADQRKQTERERDCKAQSRQRPSKSPPASDTPRCGASVASRARQRRPALLLTHPGDASQDESTGLQATMTIINAQTDGTVRARVGTSHLRRSASMKVLLAATQMAGESPADWAPSKASSFQCDELNDQQGRPTHMTRKKSEFDPRSLRRLSCSETARALRRRDSELEAGGQKREQLMRDRARRRKSLANLTELKLSELDDDVDDVQQQQQQPIVTIESDPMERQKLPSSSFSLLRQSFKQKSLSRTLMGLATSRHSMRVKREHHVNEVSVHQEEEAAREQAHKSTSSRHSNRLEALQVAEANLQAARHLKQQAQRLREQQQQQQQQQRQQRKNELQQQPKQSTPIGQNQAAAFLLYNQQIQLQKHHQQQLIYQAQQLQQQQQQFAAFSKGFNVLDPLAHYQQQQPPVGHHHHHQQQQHLHHQQQFQFQQSRERSHQLAYLGNQSAAHFMAAAQQKHQQLALVQTPDPSLGLASMLLGGQPTFSFEHNQPGGSLISRQQQQQQQQPQQQQQRTCLANYPPAQHFPSPAYLTTAIEQQQQQQQQHFIPMSVNHHSSLNIVYTAAAAAAAVANQQQHHYLLQQQQLAAAVANQHQLNHQFTNLATPFVDQLAGPLGANQTTTTVMQQQQFLADLVAATEPCQAPVAPQAANFRSKHSSLGASVRRTMRSILKNGKSVAEYAISSAGMARPGPSAAQTEPMIVIQQPSKPLKSALKTSSAIRNEQHLSLNSEGSDGSSSSSSSSPPSSSSSSSLSSNDSFQTPARAVTSGCRNKKDDSQAKYSTTSSSTRSSLDSNSSSTSSSDSSLICSSATLTQQSGNQAGLAELAECEPSDSNDEQPGRSPSERRRRMEARRRSLRSRPSQAAAMSVSQRKNVTFSPKLTSIL